MQSPHKLFAVHLLTAAILLLCSVGARAQAPTGQDVNDLRERIEKLEKQNQELMDLLKAQMKNNNAAPAATEIAQPPSQEEMKKLVQDVLKQTDADKKKADEEKKKADDAAGFVVGKDLSMKAYWNHGLWLETPDKAFKVHPGGRVQFDMISPWANDNVMFGPGGIGVLDDAFAFRRARLEIDGTFYEVVDFFLEFDFINTFDADPLNPALRTDVFNTPVPTDLWAQVTHIPWINTVRVGNQKPPISLEHLTSSRFLPFLERSFNFDAFVGGLDNGFRPGIQLINWSEDESITWSAGVFKNNQSVNGWNVGDGELDVTGRITWCPIYEDNGRCVLHFGLGASHRDVDENAYRLRARTLLRNGPAVLHNALASIVIGADTHDMVVPEFAFQYGPFQMQAEYFANWFGNTTFPAAGPTAVNRGTTFYQGAYVQALYFLTGDYTTYNRKLGSGAAFARTIPHSPYYFVHGDGGNLFSAGAWQIGARYSWVDLNSNGADAGIIHDLTLGLNWYLNPNLKFQWNYCAAYRDAVNPASTGWVHGLGMRMAYDF